MTPIKHGRIDCNVCWDCKSDSIQEVGNFRLVRDPGYWGASSPSTLVLGISKGNTQSRAFANQPFDTIAFKGMRPRLLQALQSVGLLKCETVTNFERRFTSVESEFAFASLVRCSLTGLNPKTNMYTADSPVVVPAFQPASAAYQFAKNCITQFLAPQPTNTKLVILLGNADAYMSAAASVISAVRGPVMRVNQVAFDSRNVRFVHVAHPSKGNGHFGKFLSGEGTSGRKRDLARAAVEAL